MSKSNILFFIFISLIFSASLTGQEKINLKNPSFEGKAGIYPVHIRGWLNCGLRKFRNESPPDILPVADTLWGVTLPPMDKKTYLGLVVRFNETYESVSQKLKSPLVAGTCYSFSAYLAQSKTYLSPTIRLPDSLENFDQPAILIIWGGDKPCSRQEILAKSLPVENSVWKENLFSFHPKRTHQYITIEAFYKLPITEAYNGHVLVDYLSPIIEIPCD